MKILVCISKVPDTTARINFTDNNSRFDQTNVQWIINPYDEWYALVRALELKEAGGGNVTVINVGPAENDQVIRKALAIGADDAVRINLDPEDTYTTAVQIAEYARKEGFDLILTGKETIDFNNSSLGGMVAEMLDMPFVSYASHLNIEGGKLAVISREIEGGTEVLEAPLPLVISAQKDMAEARIPSMRGIMAARTKPLNVVEPVAADTLSKVSRFELPPAKTGCKYIDADNVAELVDLLHNEAKVI